MEIIVLLLWILLAAIILAAIAWVLDHFLPRPWPVLIVAVLAIVLLIALLGDSGEINIGDGR